MRYDMLYPFVLPPGEDLRLMLAILHIHRDRPAHQQRPMRWDELTA